MIVSLIAAISTNRAIGIAGGLPWHLPSDLKFFKEKTMGHHLLMGRKTWDLFPKPLPGRISLVVSRKPITLPEGVFGFDSVEKAMEFACQKGETELMVIGGGEIYAACLPLAHRLYLTHVFARVPDAQTFFPPVRQTEWEIRSSRYQQQDEKNAHPMEFLVLERKAMEAPTIPTPLRELSVN